MLSFEIFSVSGMGYTFCYTKDLNIGAEECNLKIECPDTLSDSTLIQSDHLLSTLFSKGITPQVTQGHTNPMLRQTTATRGYVLTTQKSQSSTQWSIAGSSNTSESRDEQNETEWPPSKAPAKPATISFLFSLMLSLHLF